VPVASGGGKERARGCSRASPKNHLLLIRTEMIP
jgi:hypothetical protein